MPLKSGYKKKGGKRRGIKKARVPRPLKYNARRVGGPNTARVEHTYSTTILANQPYDTSFAGIIGTRPQALAPNFALYRIAKVVMRFKPNFDTYVSNPAFVGGAGPVTVPTLYWKMNRFADQPAAFTGDDLKRLGAKPIRFDDKQITVSYKPNILLSRSTNPNNPAVGGSDSGQVKMTPWLNTDSSPMTAQYALSTTEHWGHFFIVECSVNGNGATPVGTYDVTVYYEFKNPRVEWTQSESVPRMVHLSGDRTVTPTVLTQ